MDVGLVYRDPVHDGDRSLQCTWGHSTLMTISYSFLSLLLASLSEFVMKEHLLASGPGSNY